MNNAVEANIQNISDCVARIQKKEPQFAETSEIWQNCTNVLSYMNDLSAQSLRHVRLHTELFTGECLHSTLFTVSNQDPARYAEKTGYTFATENLPRECWLSEPPVEGWLTNKGALGCRYEDVVINADIARYQLYFENFHSTGMFDTIQSKAEKSVIMEIGAGYGAIGHQLLSRQRGKICYVVCDLPMMLLYTGCYIATHHPAAKIFIYDPDNLAHQYLDDALLEYDLVLIPAHRLSALRGLSRIDYAINTVSMAEMIPSQVQEYIDFIKQRLVHYFYFHNYRWEGPTPLHHMLGKYFFLRPHLDFFEDFAGQSRPITSNYLSTFFCTVSREADQALAGHKVKMQLPVGQAAQVSLLDDSIRIRRGPGRYRPYSAVRSSIASSLILRFPVNARVKEGIRRRVVQMV